jgi:hypothetical protein
MQRHGDAQEAVGLPRTMIYPVLSRVHNVGTEGGATVTEENAYLINQIPFAEGASLVSDVAGWEFLNAESERSNDEPDGVDPWRVEAFSGQDHYDCIRFEGGGFGASVSQLDCPE